MSKRCELQKEYFKQYGNYKGVGKYSDDYVKWLEDKIIPKESEEKVCNEPKFTGKVIFIEHNLTLPSKGNK